MSDAGIYAAIEAEIVARIGTISGVAEGAIPTCGIEDLVYRVPTDGVTGRLPAIGVAFVSAAPDSSFGTTPSGFIGIASKRLAAATLWEVCVVNRSQRGASDAHATARLTVERVRDQLHYYASAIQPLTKYIWKSDKRYDFDEPDLIGYVSVYALTAMFEIP